jgi:hypothetical protein
MLPTETKITPKKLRLLALLGIALVTMSLLIGGLAKLEFLPGEPFPLAALLQSLQNDSTPILPSLPVPTGIVRLVLVCIWVLLIIAVVAFIISPEVRRETIKRIIRYAILFLIIFGLIQMLQPMLQTPEGLTQESGAAGPLDPEAIEPLPAPPNFVVNPPQWFVAGVTILLISLVLLTLWFIWRHFTRQNEEAETPLEQLTREAQAALKGIQTGADLKDTIMRCYFEMSQILRNERGILRQEAMTPREFEQHLARSGLDSEHIQRLTRLFEHVRYGSKTAGRQEEQEAVACLSAIVQTYGRS